MKIRIHTHASPSRREFLGAAALIAGAPWLARAQEAKPAAPADERFTLPRDENAADVERIERLARELEAGKVSVQDVLTDEKWMQLHELPRFRKLVAKHSRASKLTLVTRTEPGAPLRVSGEVVDHDKKPVAGALVYAYHTSAKGWYSDRAAHFRVDSGDVRHARLFGYVLTDERGAFELTTIHPEGYPGTNLPQHIHVHVDAGGETRLVTEIRFEDDPRMTTVIRLDSRAEGMLVQPVDRSGPVQLVSARLVLHAPRASGR